MNGITIGLNENVHFAQKARLAFISGCANQNVAPIDLVEKGERTIDDWLRLLAAKRELEEQIYTNWQRGRCAFVSDDGIRFQLLGLMADETLWTTKSLHFRLQAEAKLGYIRKILVRLLEDGQVSETSQIVRGLEVTLWSITKRGQREYNGHLARVGKASHTSASKSVKSVYTSASINAGQE